MNTNIHFDTYLVQFFLEQEMFQAKVVEKIKTHILFSTFFSCKSCRLWDKKFTLEQDTKAQKSRWGWWSKPRNGCFTPGKEPAPNVFEAGWTPGPAWNGAENLVPAGIRSPHP